ncbi:MAG: glucoamylase family protein [Janthinobacterium lividum]
MIPLLALASPTHPVDAAVWSAWSQPTMPYANIEYISGGDDPLFVYRYRPPFFDFAARRFASR